jgi:tetratricopeptide (TPR) repeat protein
LLPASPGCLVLITSRLGLGNLDDARPLTLGVLAPEEAVALFSNVMGAERLSSEPAELLEEVVERCGRLPLAIRILATRLRSRPAWTLTDLAVRLRTGRIGVYEMESGRRSVAGAFRLSYDQLDADHQRLFGLLGLHPGSDFDGHAAAALTALDGRDVEQMLEALVDAHLLESRTYARYSFHDLLRVHAADTVQHETTPDERHAALDQLFRYYLHAAKQAMNMYAPADRRDCPDAPSPTPFTRYFRFRDEAVGWLDTERSNLVSLSGCAVDHGWSAYAAQLSSCLDRYLEHGFHCDDGLALHRNALRAAQASGNRVSEARALSSLGITYRNMRSHINALSCLRSALRCLPEGGNAPYRANLLNDLGNVLIHVGYFFEAEEKCKQAAELYRAAGDRVGEGRSLINLGDISRYVGRFEAANMYGLRALELARSANDKVTVGNGLRVLGFTYCRMAHHEIALDYLKQGLRESRTIDNRIGEYYSLAGIACALRGLRKYEEALKACWQVLEISHEIGDRNGEYEARQGLGETLVACGRAGDALSHLTRALDLSYSIQQIYDQARALETMAAAFRELGDTGKAREHGQRALGIYRRLRLHDASRMEQWLLELQEQV